MEAFHTLRVRNGNKNFSMADFELLVAIISALEWREHNGHINLVTDNIGGEYLNSRGLLDIWDNVYSFLDEMVDLRINEDVFWAGAKIFALSHQKAPCVMMDMDFIIWNQINFNEFAGDIAVIHREEISDSVYPTVDFFKFKNGWTLPNWLNWKVNPCNGALVYFGSDSFIEQYTSFAVKFMQMADAGQDRLTYMVFAEQRWMAMCADRMDIQIYEISPLRELFGKRQKNFTHIWGYKQFLRDNHHKADDFCRKCAKRIKRDFPFVANKLSNEAWSAKYF